MNAFSTRIAISAVFCIGFALGGTSLADATATEPGVWTRHELRFSFLGFTTTYSCDGLADQLKRLLLASGARADAKSSPAACTGGFGRPDKFASAYLTFYSLAAPGPDKAEGAPVAGNWKMIDISPHSPRDLGRGDCELIEQFRDQLLPLFTTRNLENRVTCVPHQESGSSYSLKFETFTANRNARL
jgi:hypothetical protein